ncbi:MULTISPECIES: Z1 domain-containing protein [Aeromicrobium]|uniref:Z1 domain-containing protein n=1 Tax=Aeromicrobium TaxID=2040 RepID=UPI00257A88C0|nr:MULTISPECIES: Z1 domain-containing protein [Aeromicrobium]
MSNNAPHGMVRIFRPTGSVSEPSWWETYATHLGGINATSRGVIEEDAEFIVDRGVFGVGDPADGQWPSSRERSGLVMGAVQSGKTASMMAVTAKALDRGVDAVVILAGTRTALWKQTHERATDQLAFATNAHKRRLLVPRTIPADPPDVDIDLLYQIGAPAALTLALKQNKPILAIVMKNWAHLQRLAKVMRDVYAGASARDKPFHVLVIDDEADDSSVVDASAEAASPTAEPKQVPRRIVDIWEDRAHPGETVNSNVFATYLAYTATPHANFLQDDQNPLAPRDFVASLRTAGAEGIPEIRTPTYRVPEGIKDWYTGGDTYYKTLSSVPLCIPTDQIAPNEQVPEAVRAFLVASAVRLMRVPNRLGPRDAKEATFVSLEDAKQQLPAVASMLIHPSSGMDDHFRVAQELLRWSAGAVEDADGDDVDTRIDRQLGSAGIEQDMAAQPERWLHWLGEYSKAATAVVAMPGAGDRPVPQLDEWRSVQSLILSQILPATSVRVINSHEDADDRPQYSPSHEVDETWRAPQNLSTIFISGNVMSRGLTLEGLTTTLFTRRAGIPFADTQMQMQRWFGYRGSYIDLCRVFMPQDVLGNFVSYHEDDEALRLDVLARMESNNALPDISVLQGRTYLATGKIANLRGQPLFPGPKPFITHMNAPGHDDANARLVAELFAVDPINVGSGARPRGLMRGTPMSLLEAADVLDELCYADHGPGRDGPEGERWRSAENYAQLGADPVVPLFRAPSVQEGRDLGAKSPYWVAAYLRFWHACLIRRVPSVVTTDEPPTRWDLVDLRTKRSEQPKFWVGLRFGDGSIVTDGPLAALAGPVRAMKRQVAGNELRATWGSRGRGEDGEIRGDDQFDYRARHRAANITPSGDRKAGEDGLILFHPIERSDGSVTTAVGLSIPLGGPDQMRAMTRNSSD